MNIHDYLTTDCIFFSDASDKETVFNLAIKRAFDTGKLSRIDDFTEAIKKREDLISTGIGLGIAIPHAKIAGIKDFFITCVILKYGVEWESIDKQPVRIVFLIGGPADRQTDYLKILSKLILIIRNSSRRENLLKAKTPEEVMNIFKTV